MEAIGKGKMRAEEVIGLPMQPPEPQQYLRPSLETACQLASEHWPARLSPPPIAPPSSTRTSVTTEMNISGDSVVELGNLVLALVDWMAIGVLDLGRADLGFLSPPGSSITWPALAAHTMPTDIHTLRADHTYYSA